MVTNNKLLCVLLSLTMLLGYAFLPNPPAKAAPLHQEEPATSTTPEGSVKIFLPLISVSVSLEDAEPTEVEATAIGITETLTTTMGLADEQGQIQASSASGCNHSVCIYVKGNGLKVDAWWTTVKFPTSMCTYAAYWVNGKVVAHSKVVCGSSAVSWWIKPPLKFHNGDVVCNTWVHGAGKPCITIHN